jgi:hypothetical protein
MGKHAKNILIVLSVLLFCIVTSRGESDVKPIDLIKADDSAKRIQGMQALHQVRQDVIQALIPVLDGQFSAEVKEDAAKVLGEYRASEAVDALMRNIQLDLRTRFIKGFPKDEDLHPVSHALAKIGTPAIPALLTKITQADSQALINRCAQICLEIEGRDVAEMVIRKHSEKQTAVDAKQRLSQALDVISKTK